MKNRKHPPTPLRLLIITAISIIVTEALIMLLQRNLPPLSMWGIALLDACLLTLLVVPMLYLFLFRPMILYTAESQQTEDALGKARDKLPPPRPPFVRGGKGGFFAENANSYAVELERRVEEWTTELSRSNALLQREVNEHKQAEKALRESEERYALAARCANEGLWDWNLKTNEVYFSPRWKSILGCEENEIGSSPDEWLSRVHSEDIDRVKTDIASHLEGNTPHLEIEHRLLHKDGTSRWMLARGLAVRDADGKTYRMAGSLTDVTDRNAFYDPLTRLPSRALFMDRLGHALRSAKRRKGCLFAVLFLDLDRFKVVNDSLGHIAGDQLLILVARRLQSCLRTSDTVARLGGDEFTILLDDVKELSNVRYVADRIQKELSLPFELEGKKVFSSASIGVALSATGHDHPEDILRDADTALYRAKARGRARCEVFDASMRDHAMSLLQLEVELWHAIEHREFRVFYQPIVSMETGRIIGCEALVRWQHPQRGRVSPAEFIPLAEETGLIMPIGEWVLRTACAQNKAWQDSGLPPLWVAVNLSAHQFRRKDLGKTIAQILQEISLEPQYLKLELTESNAMENAEETTKTLRELREIGVQLAIDDFGTGYSSLSYLKRFPIDDLKIDRSFVMSITTDPDDAAIATAVITLAHSLKLQVIAEGVETEEQLAFLGSHQCDAAQGYLFSRPTSAESFAELLQSRVPLFAHA